MAPNEGLPRALGNQADLEATYRFMANPRVTPQRILEPHFQATAARASSEELVLAIHDTTEAQFSGEARQGLGRCTNNKPGFFVHVTLAVAATDARPLGALALTTWARTADPVPKKLRRSYEYQVREDKESNRWRDHVREVERRMRSPMIHVMDREGDQFRVLSEVIGLGAKFVIRAMHKDRVLAPNDEGLHNLTDAMTVAPVILDRDVVLSRRDTEFYRMWANRPRESRPARLQVSATSIEVKRSWVIYEDETPPRLRFNVVRVFEVDPPEGAEAVEWVLLTNLPVATVDEVAFVVDCYRRRWIIEEYFKAIKTGCNYEKLQLESLKTLANALAVIVPIAWQMLLLRQLARADETVPATRALTKTQLVALRALSRSKLPTRPTVRDALLAVAQLGGHIRNNGEPGWLVLYRGFRDLVLVERALEGIEK